MTWEEVAREFQGVARWFRDVGHVYRTPLAPWWFDSFFSLVEGIARSRAGMKADAFEWESSRGVAPTIHLRAWWKVIDKGFVHVRFEMRVVAGDDQKTFTVGRPWIVHESSAIAERVHDLRNAFPDRWRHILDAFADPASDEFAAALADLARLEASR